MGGMAGFGAPRPRREPVEVAERKPEDRRLDKLLSVRKQRLDRFERERKEARAAWRAARAELRAAKLRWRAARDEAKDFWAAARKEFLAMTITSGQYQQAKAVFERLKRGAADQRVQCLDAVARCKAKGQAFFAARAQVLTANRQQEKLGVMRDELRRQQQQDE